MRRHVGGLLAGTALAVLALLTVGVSSGAGQTYKCMVINDRLNTTYKPTQANWNALQAAIDAAAVGDTLWVRGACYGSIEITKSLTLTGQQVAGLTSPPTIYGVNEPLAGQSAVRVSGSGVQVEINSLTITNGGNAWNPPERGGGIYNEQATLTLNKVTLNQNRANHGGGIYNDHGTVELTNSTIDSNRARSGYGGGIASFYGSLTMNASTITNNVQSALGGGIYAISATVVISESQIAHNYLAVGAGGSQGGGIYAHKDDSQLGAPYTTLTLTDTKIDDNKASHSGGGIFAVGGTVTLSGSSEVSANDGGVYGGGVFATNLAVGGDATIHGNHAGQDGGGAWVYHLTMSENAKIYGNSVSSFGHGGGIYGNHLSYLSGCVAGEEGDTGVNVFGNSPDDIYTTAP